MHIKKKVLFSFSYKKLISVRVWYILMNFFLKISLNFVGFDINMYYHFLFQKKY